jgi:hypothetical protein
MGVTSWVNINSSLGDPSRINIRTLGAFADVANILQMKIRDKNNFMITSSIYGENYISLPLIEQHRNTMAYYSQE